jgi:quinol monooxygenase YgiN
MITIVAKHVIQNEQITAYKNLAKEMIAETLKESGCIQYNLFEDTTHPNILTFMEEWENKAAIESHFNSSHFKRIIPLMQPLLLEATEINLYQKVNL